MNSQTHNRSDLHRKTFFTRAALLLLGSFIMLMPGPAGAFKIADGLIGTTPGHENITREGLGFLKFQYRESVVDGNWSRDFNSNLISEATAAGRDYCAYIPGFCTLASSILDENTEPKYHFDGSNFRTTTALMNTSYDEILGDLVLWYFTRGTTAGDTFLWKNEGHPALTPFMLLHSEGLRTGSSALGQFGSILHAAQDLYSHSNWVELRNEGHVTARLYDTREDYWLVPQTDWEIHPLHPNLVVAEGNAAGLQTVHPGWDVDYNIGPPTGYSDKSHLMLVYPGTGYQLSGLFSGRFGFGAGEDKTHETVFWNHNYEPQGFPVTWINGLNKDTPFSPDDVLPVPTYHQAAELAVLQTAHEWDRLMALILQHGGPNGEAIVTELKALIIDYKTDIYLDASHQTDGNQYTTYVPIEIPLDLPFPIPDATLEFQNREGFETPSGTETQPYRYLSIALHAVEPAQEATMSIAPGTDYVGVQRLGGTGQPLRLQLWAGKGPGIARLEN